MCIFVFYEFTKYKVSKYKKKIKSSQYLVQLLFTLKTTMLLLSRQIFIFMQPYRLNDVDIRTL